MTPVQETGPGPGARPRVHPALWLLIVVGFVTLAGWIGLRWMNDAAREVYRERTERFVGEHRLAGLADAQELVRAGTGDYWRKDVAGLADFPLIEPGIAQADASSTRGDFLGYLFRSLPFSNEQSPDPKRYAILCYPVRPVGGMYVLTQDRAIWRKPAVAGGVDVFPADPAAEGWQKTP